MRESVEFQVDALDQRRARAEARARLFARRDRVTLGRYELEARLGSGSWGVVYRAYDPRAGRRVALKVVHGVAGESKWRREAQLLARLQHPNIVDVYDVGEDCGRAYLVTELVPGARTLTQWLRTRRLERDDLIQGFISLADALSAVHAQGVLHRDIKPDNILVDVNATFRLVDFGLACDLDDLGVGFEGTPAFVPSEVRRGRPPDVGADVFGLCASLWFSVCGVPPPSGKPPPRLRSLLRRGLASRPGARFPRAEDLKAALERVNRSATPWPLFAATILLGSISAGVAVPTTEDASEAQFTPSESGRRIVDAYLADIARLHEAEQFDQAITTALEALRSAERLEGRAALEVALGRARYANGDLVDAEHVLESAFFGASASQTVDLAFEAALLRLEVAVEASDMGAIPTWRREARAWERRNAPVSVDARIRLAIAESKHEALLGHLSDALVRLPDDPGTAEPGVAVAFWCQRGEVLNRMGRFEDGRSALRTALAVAQREFPPDHWRVRFASWNLATSHHERGEYAQAAAVFEELLGVMLQMDPPPQHDIAELERNLGGVHFEMGSYALAEQYTRRALEVTQRRLGPAHDRTLDTFGNLAAILFASGNSEAVRAVSWKALVAAETEYGSEHPRLVSLLSNLSVIELETGDLREAESLLRRAASILNGGPGRSGREMAVIQTNLASVLARRGESRSAIEAASRALAMYEATLGPAHPELAETLLQLAQLEQAGHRGEVAGLHARRVLALPQVDRVRRARAAFVLAQVEAMREPASSPLRWIEVARRELEPVGAQADPALSAALERWRHNWRAERSKLHR